MKSFTKKENKQKFEHKIHIISPYNSERLSILINSVSKINVESGGIFSPAPDLPYPNSGGMTKRRFSPSHIPSKPWSQPLITWPDPTVNVSGCPRGIELSNSVPSSSVP